jgi:Protein of unknown function (DUF3551)
MRNALLALMACSVVGAVSAPAAARELPWCIKGCDYASGLGDCSFATLQQCEATASGRLGYCAANPYFSQKADLSPDRMSRRRN